MKTPREILLARHQTANAKLDEIRRGAVEELNKQDIKQQGFDSWFLGSAKAFWRELILPKPQAWAAVATLWILIFALKLSTQDTSPVATKKTALSPEVVAELKEQKAFFGELAGLPPLPEVNPPKAILPRPRSARNPESSRA